MIDLTPLSNYDLKRAIDAELERFDLSTVVRLGDATRRIENALALAGEAQMARRINTRLVAQRLRMKGMQRVGWDGHGYNREPVYQRLDRGLAGGS